MCDACALYSFNLASRSIWVWGCTWTWPKINKSKRQGTTPSAVSQNVRRVAGRKRAHPFHCLPDTNNRWRKLDQRVAGYVGHCGAPVIENEPGRCGAHSPVRQRASNTTDQPSSRLVVIACDEHMYVTDNNQTPWKRQHSISLRLDNASFQVYFPNRNEMLHNESESFVEESLRQLMHESNWFRVALNN